MKEIKGVDVKKIRVFKDDEGHAFETLRADDSFFEGNFGQNFLSFTRSGVIKGLHKHENLVEYVTCIKGNILFVLIKEIPGQTPIVQKILMGEKNMVLVKTPKKIWHGYIALPGSDTIVLYTMDTPYNPTNIDQETKDPYAFGDVWKMDES